MITVEQFFNKYNGKYKDWDKKFGFQCVDIVRFYIKEVLGWEPYTALPAGANAKSIFLNFPSSNNYFFKALNGKYNYPKKGDIIFWGFYPFVTGLAGHVAICSDANSMKFISFDQNYPTGSFCKFVNHSFKGVLGWLTPKK